MQKITPFLWFDGRAEEAMNFYTSVFPESRIGQVARYPKGSPGGMDGKVMTAAFTLHGHDFLALNGGPNFKFSPAVSFVVDCKTQEEVDMYWEKLSEDGTTEQCGWLRDKFGLSWQVVPGRMNELMTDKDPAKAERVMKAMLQMTKLDIAKLEAAYNNE